MTNQCSQKQPGLCCPACAYNLTGSCTVETPAGNCPECGLAFDRKKLIERRWEQAKFSMSTFILEILLLPIAIGFISICAVVGLSSAFSGNPSDLVGVLAIAGPPLLLAFMVGGLLASQYYPASVSGIPPEHRRGLKRHIILPWLLFFVIETVLTGMYFIGGCAVVIAVLFR